MKSTNKIHFALSIAFAAAIVWAATLPGSVLGQSGSGDSSSGEYDPGPAVPYVDPLCPQGYDCAWVDTRDVTSFGVTRNNGNGHGFQYDPATQNKLCEIKGYERSIDGYNRTAKWSKCNNETHIEWRGYWYKYGCTSRTYLTTTYCIKPKQTSAPTIAWSQSPGSAQCNAQYTVEARGSDADGDLVAVSVDKDGTPFAYEGGGDGSNSTSGNPTSDSGPKSVTFTAWATDSRGQKSPTISHTVNIGSCQAPNREPSGVVDTASCDVINGWAYDPDKSSDSIGVHFYVDGAFLTSTIANGSRPDVNAAFGISGNHGYSINTPASIKNGQQRTLQVYAIDANGGSNPMIGQSTITCQPPVVNRRPSGVIAVSPTNLPATGGPVTVTWAVSDASSCTASGAWSGAKAASGSQSVNVGSTSTFTLSCTGAGGEWSDSATVTVKPAPSGSISASPTSLPAGGGSVTVTWSVSNATSCAASGGWSGVRSASGSQSVQVAQSTNLRLTCVGDGGSWSGDANVDVALQCQDETRSYNCSSSFSGYDYQHYRETQSYTIYQSCNISDSAYQALNVPSGTQTRVSRSQYDDCPQCWLDTHTYNGTTWNCSRSMGGYEFGYFRTTQPITAYVSCNISPGEKTALESQGFSYSHKVRSSSSGPGQWTDTHYMSRCSVPQNTCTDSSASNYGGSLPCRYSTPQCQDGSDNDADGLIDTADPGCSSPSDNDEWNFTDTNNNNNGNGGNGGNGGNNNPGGNQPIPGFTVTADSGTAKVQFLGEIGGVSEPRRIEANPVNGFSGPVTLSVASVRPKSGAALPAGLEILYAFDGGAFAASPSTSQSYNPSIGGGRYIGEQGLVGTTFKVSFSKAVKEPYEVVIEGVSGSLRAQYTLTIEPYNLNPSYREI